jgi:hypothetical protein
VSEPTPPLILLDTRDTGAAIVTEFGIAPAREREAGARLLDHLRRGAEVWLRNDLDEGGEGCTQFRHGPGGYWTAVFGHGWTGRWKPTDEAGVLTAVAELAELNRAAGAGDRGEIRYPKS